MSAEAVYAIQDDTGRVCQVHTQDHGAELPLVGDVGQFAQDDGADTPAYAFTVTQVIDMNTFSVTFSTDSDVAKVMKLVLPFELEWLSGAANTGTQSVDQIDGANAYISVDQFRQYFNSRGIDYTDSPVEAIQHAIVKATDYLDQKYRYKGTKLIHSLGDPLFDANLAFLDPFLSPTGVGIVPFLTTATSTQTTEWPRNGVVDYSGNTVVGIPRALKGACAELANRALNGTELQPDYSSDVVKDGAVVQQITEDVGPIHTTTIYDTRQGLGFFANFPQIDRMLQKAGLLMAGGGRVIVR